MSDSEKSKIVVLIGNGLGRAFNNEGFATECILKRLFDPSTPYLQPETLNFFKRLFRNSFPQNEEELGLVEELNDALDIIGRLPFRIFLCDHTLQTDVFTDKAFKHDFANCFSDLKTNFLKSIQESSDHVINDKKDYAVFAENLRKFIKSTLPTIATLNYDILLYDAFLKPPFLDDVFTQKENGYTDGFLKEPQSKELPKFVDDFFKFSDSRKTYLHLHGAYFYTQQKSTTEEKIIKQHVNYVPNPKEDSLVILTSQKKKIQNIFSSPKDFFRIYSGYFFEKIIEAKHIIIFGYGGRDEYLNTTVRYAVTKALARQDYIKITVICRSEDEPSDDELKKKWKNCLIGKDSADNFHIYPDDQNDPLTSDLRYNAPFEIRKFLNPIDFAWNYFFPK